MSGLANQEEINNILDNLVEEYSENKKVKGAKKHIYNNIQFDSALEISCYRLLIQENIPFEYNKLKFNISEGFRLEYVNFYNQVSKKDKRFIQYLTKSGEKLKLPAITLTPDFHILINDYLILIETKGHPNDVYPYKRKLLFKYLEEKQFKATNTISKGWKGIYYFEPKNIKQIKESIKVIKDIINEESRSN